MTPKAQPPRERSRLLFRGFGTLVIGIVLLVLLVVLVPSIAPEHMVRRDPQPTETTIDDQP